MTVLVTYASRTDPAKASTLGTRAMENDDGDDDGGCSTGIHETGLQPTLMF